MDIAPAFVKFVRGTSAAFKALGSNVDSDTLYFISDTGENSGSLYLGKKLISGGSGSNVTVLTSLSDLEDIVVEDLEDRDILVYDKESGNWINQTPAQVASLILNTMTGATENGDGVEGLVPTPKAGDQDKFLTGNGTWTALADNSDFSDLKTIVANLIGDDTDKTVRQIAVAALAEALIPENAKESLDSLQEIADWIQSHPDDAATLNSKLTAVEGILYDTSVEGEDETSVVKEGLVTVVGNLSTDLASLTTTVEEQSDDIEALYELLTWHDLVEESEDGQG